MLQTLPQFIAEKAKGKVNPTEMILWHQRNGQYGKGLLYQVVPLQNMFQETNLGNTNGGPNSVLASFCRETTCSNYERILFFIVFSAQFWVYDLVTL